jgi:Kef-type K+ transport system membrane component KefB
MEDTSFIYTIFLIFTGAAVFATAALYTRQSLLVAYMFLGVLLGPHGFKLIPDTLLLHQIGDVGIIFLLFLLGLDLSPYELLHSLRKSILVTVISAVIFMAIGFTVAFFFGFNFTENVLIGATLVFSSTIIGLKLLPTTALHHQPIGELMISILLLQDLIAILMLVFVHGASMTGSKWVDMSLAAVTLPGLLGFAFLLQRFVIKKLIRRFNKIKEYIFLLAVAWCLGMAKLAQIIGLSGEIGAFIAGVSIAEGPIALYIVESLKPLRDFCLVMFFFAVGAAFNLDYLPQVIFPALILATVVLIAKPWIFRVLLKWSGEKNKRVAMEVGVRLAQTSEFSLLLAYLASETVPAMISPRADYLIQATTLLTFMVSSYVVVLRYPTPIAFSDKLRRD